MTCVRFVGRFRKWRDGGVARASLHEVAVYNVQITMDSIVAGLMTQSAYVQLVSKSIFTDCRKFNTGNA